MRRLIYVKSSNIIMYLKARRLGWRTVWCGEGVICMGKE